MKDEKENPVLTINDEKYILRIPKDEKQLEEMVKEHVEQIFGKGSLYFDVKEKIDSMTGIGSKPDGYAISLFEPRWYVVEVEVFRHSPYKHILPQITKFMSGIENRESQNEITEWLYEKILEDPAIKTFVERTITEEIHHFLSKLISESPTVVIIIDKKTPQLIEACGKLEVKPEIVEFKTFAKGVGLGTHTHLVCEPLEEDVHAKYDKEEKGFECKIGESKACKDYVYDPIEIVEHLRDEHDIDPDDQIIDGWTYKHQRAWKKYLSRKKMPR